MGIIFVVVVVVVFLFYFQPKAKKAGKKRSGQPTPYDTKKKGQEAKPTLFDKRPKSFGIGQNIQPKKDVSRFVRWPRYVKLQRQRAVLHDRLKVPASVNQFTRTLDKNTATSLFKLLHKYRPEDKVAKKQRLLSAAEAKSKGEKVDTGKKPNFVKFGVNHVTGLVENKKARLVVIAHDVDPLEIVIYLPALCRKMGVPYCIVKGKARLGMVCRKKTAACVAITNVNKEDTGELNTLVNAVKELYKEQRNAKGGGKLGHKSSRRPTPRPARSTPRPAPRRSCK